jgi:hypothetical protein
MAANPLLTIRYLAAISRRIDSPIHITPRRQIEKSRV